MALEMAQLDGRVPAEMVMGSTPDISAYALFDWYQPVWFHHPVNGFPHEKILLGRWIGVAEVTTDIMACHILKGNGEVLIRKSVWAVTEDESRTDAFKETLRILDEGIRKKVGDAVKQKDIDPNLDTQFLEPPDDLFDDNDEEVVNPVFKQDTVRDIDDLIKAEPTPTAYDEYLTAEVILPHGGEPTMARVMRRQLDIDGKPVGTRNANPILDTRMYEVEYPDGSTEAVTANLIAENLFSQIDHEGRSMAILKDIVDHRKNGNAVSKDDGYTVDKRGIRHPRITTKGWELQVEWWRDGSTSWIPLADLKQSNMLEVAEYYAVANKIAEEPAFAWWVRSALRTRDRVIKKAKTRYWKRTHKYGVELPKSVKKITRD